MQSKSTSKSKLRSSIILLIAISGLANLVSSQAECSARTFPATVPMRAGESLLINLQGYFQGNNISFAVLPTSPYSSVDEMFACRQLGRQNIGKVVSSVYLTPNETEVVGILASPSSPSASYIFHYIQLANLAVTSLPLPPTLTNCSRFALTPLNRTHFDLVVNCKYPAPYTYALVSTTAKLSTVAPEWDIITAPLYSYTATMDMTLHVQDQVLLRGVYSTSNSYVEVWSWNGEEREVVGVIDKTVLRIPAFNLKQMQRYGNVLVLMDFQTGLYMLRIRNSRRVSIIASFLQPFFEGFDYDPATGLLYLFKKGKVVSMIIQNLQHENLLVGQSFNILKYQPIIKTVTLQNKLITLGETFISVFGLFEQKSSYRHYNLYASDKAINMYLRSLSNQPPTLLLIRNSAPTASYFSCSVRTPFLRLKTPESFQQVTVLATSLINGDSTVCRQSFRQERLVEERNLIYDNGYTADNQIIFANLPGQGRVELLKYGVGRNISYQVVVNPSSKIDYTSTIQKLAEQPCVIQGKPIPLGNSIQYASTWLNIIITKISYENTLKYYLCDNAKTINCTSKVQTPGVGAVQQSAYQLIEQTDDYSISYEAIVLQRKVDTEIVVRKMIVQPRINSLQISEYCLIRLPNRTAEYSNVTQLQIVNNRLFVLMAYRKEIRIYDLLDTCTNIANLTSGLFPGPYFSPRSMHFDPTFSSRRHQTLIIQQWDQLIVLRLQGARLNQRPTIVSISKLPQSTNGSILVAHPYLLYFSLSSNRALCYFIDDSYQLQYLRQLPLQGMSFASPLRNRTGIYMRNDFFKLLDESNVAVNLVEASSQTVRVKVFRLDQIISVASQYMDIPISSQKEDVLYLSAGQSGRGGLVRLQLLKGPINSYLYCKSSDFYLNPSAFFRFTDSHAPLDNYIQNLTINLRTRQDLHSHHFRISLSNIGVGISRGGRFPSRGSAISPQSTLVLNDKHWFTGSVYNYQFQCKNCKDRIKFSQKIIVQSKQTLPFTSKVFSLEQNSRTINLLSNSFSIILQYNHSAWPIQQISSSQSFQNQRSSAVEDQLPGYGLKQAIPAGLGATECIDRKTANHMRYSISLCWKTDATGEKLFFLSAISTVSYKGFILEQALLSFQPQASPKLQVHDGVIVVYSSRVAILLTLWEISQQLQFIELDRIDNEDISNSICYLELVSNNSAPGTPITNILYGVIVTQCSSTLYYTSFSVYLEQQEVVDQSGSASSYSFPNIHISYAQNINLLRVWQQRHIEIPSDARIVQTITRTQPSQFEDQQILNIIVVFDRFHTYQFQTIISQRNKIIKRISLEAVFYKFGSNIATSADIRDYLVVKYVLDLGFGKLQELYGCFDLSQYVINSQQIKEYYHFAAYRFESFKMLAAEEDFPWQLNGHKITQLHHEHLEVLNISNSLKAHIYGLENNTLGEPVSTLYTQTIIVTANNPTSARSATIVLNSVDEFILSDLAIGLIVVGGLVLLVVLIIIGRVGVRRLRKRLKLVPLLQNQKAQDAHLEQQEEERSGQYRINQSQRGSLQP